MIDRRASVCSGDMNTGVPSAVRASVRLISATFAKPKSTIFTRPLGVMIRLLGLISRWMIAALVRSRQSLADLNGEVDGLRPGGSGSAMDACAASDSPA